MIDWNATSKEQCVSIIEGLRAELKELWVKYNERAAAMQDTADQVRSLYVGSEVSKRIRNFQDQIRRIKNCLDSATMPGECCNQIREIIEEKAPS